MAHAAGTRLGPYEITAAIGAGGMGQVFRARDTRLSRDVAIKVLPAEFAQDPERASRLRREAQILASLNHPGIAGIHGLEETAGTVALVMELVEGEDLSQRLARGPIPPDEAVAIAKQIAEGLEDAHEHGVIHRDLKPANIKAQRLDFGDSSTSRLPRTRLLSAVLRSRTTGRTSPSWRAGKTDARVYSCDQPVNPWPGSYPEPWMRAIPSGRRSRRRRDRVYLVQRNRRQDLQGQRGGRREAKPGLAG